MVAIEVTAARWRLPGLTVAVTTEATLTDPATRTYAPTAPATRMVLALA